VGRQAGWHIDLQITHTEFGMETQIEINEGAKYRENESKKGELI